jgi:hypothetical protein
MQKKLTIWQKRWRTLLKLLGITAFVGGSIHSDFNQNTPSDSQNNSENDDKTC